MLTKITRYKIRKNSRSSTTSHPNGKSEEENSEIFSSGSIEYRDNLVSLCKRTNLHYSRVKKGCVYLAIDRTNWGTINILTVSLIYEKRAVLIYWEFLEKKGNSNLEAQKRVLEKAIGLFSEYRIVILGDREFCLVTLVKWLGNKGLYFCLRQKKTTNVSEDEQFYQEMKALGLAPGTSLFLNEVNITKMKEFGGFNLACKWKKTYK